MIPIRDHNPSNRTPYVTYALIAANVAIFLLYWPLFDDTRALDAFFQTWAMIPAVVMEGGGYHTVLTSMFLHGGWMHLGGNMLFLWIFGDNMEDEMGHGRYLLFYITAGVGAALAHVAATPWSDVPTVGASGAIAGVMGGYLLLFPKARVDMLLILFVFFRVFTIPAWAMLLLWLGVQFMGGVTTDGSGGGVAYWAHAGGFIIGLILTLPMFLRLGGKAFWNRTEGHPPHPEHAYKFVRTSVPQVRRKR